MRAFAKSLRKMSSAVVSEKGKLRLREHGVNPASYSGPHCWIAGSHRLIPQGWQQILAQPQMLRVRVNNNS